MSRTLRFLIVAAGLGGLTLGSSFALQATSQKSRKVFGGSFEELAPEQQQLIRDWAERYSKLTGESVDAAKIYDSARISQRTTFDAVTHALLNTPLTAADGKKMGTALDLIQGLEQVAGQEPGAGGDRQFRLYVVLKPGAFRTLSESKEFFRERDNTRYHHGYPYSFRMKGTPSVQISGSRDFTRADIDVDYRSSEFPQFLFNGHLSDSNSDVRADDNLERHDERWSGLTGWWRSLFGLSGSSPPDDRPPDTAAIPSNPRVESKKPLGTAVHDFLASLFLEEEPNLAAAYFSARSLECVDRAAASRGQKIEAGMTRIFLLRELGAAVLAAGKPAKLDDVVEAASPWNPRLKPMRNEYNSLFLLLEVPDDIAATFECDSATGSGVRDSEYGKYGLYYGAAFKMKVGRNVGSTALVMWAKEGNYWKIVAFNSVDSGGSLRFPTNAAPKAPPVPALTRVKGNGDAVKSMRNFLRQWFEKQDYEAALSYFSPRSNACLAESGRPDRQNLSPEESNKLMLNGLRLISQAVGKRKLSKAIAPAMPSHELLRVVKQGDEKSFTVVDVPDAVGKWFLCSEPGQEVAPPELDLNPDKNVYGHYYGLQFCLRVPGPQAATLQTLWALEDGRWKIVAWRVENP